MTELEELLLPDADAWRRWLVEHAETAPGAWVVLAKKATTEPTTLTYREALEEALCFGWIDGQLARRDERTYRQRFTPRRPRSAWSQSNTSLVEQLIADGRMHASGLRAVDEAKANGRWVAAYAGSGAIEVPADLAEALARSAAARRTFDALSRQNRYAILYRLQTARRPETRGRRLEQFVAMLERGETIYPQGRA